MKRVRFTEIGALAIEAASLALEFVVAEPAAAAVPAPFRTYGAAAIVDIRGPLTQHAHAFWDSYAGIRGRVESALASSCQTLILCIDSPGGEVAGCFELSAEIRSKAQAAGKRVLAYVDGQAASAAYALACAADAIYVPPTASVGSIGCIKMAVDQSGLDRQMGLTFAVVASGKRKADGNPHVPLTEDALVAIQGEVDAMAGIFFGLVANARRLAPEAVASLEAASFIGAAAVAAGLADEVLTSFDGLLAMLASGQIMALAGAEEEMTEKEKAIAALRAVAAGDDKDASKCAKAALKLMGADDGDQDGDKPADDDKKDKAEGDDKPADDDKKDKAEGDDKPADDDKKKDDADAKAAASIALAAKVQSLTAKWDAREEAEERAKLMATRPDFAPEVVELMKRSPLPVVRDAVKSLPRGAKAKGQIGAARAALTVTTVQGLGQGEAGDHLPENEAHDLDVRMGLAKRATAIRHEGNKMILGVMTPAEARAELARKGAAK